MRRRSLSPILVGRQEELSALEDALLAANRGEGRLVLVAGEAGIGKTRLATEVARRARKLGCVVLWGGCSEPELSLPYLPFVEAIGNHLPAVEVPALRAELGPMALELAQLFPQFGGGPAPASLGDPGQAKLRLFESVVSLFEAWARDRGLLVVLEDIHWADGSTLELLDYLARRLGRGRVLLLATYRSDELDRRHPLTRTVQAWRRADLVENVAVGPIEPKDCEEMVAAILDAEEVSDDFVEVVHARSEGNPFFLEEMLKEALDRGELARAGMGSPSSPRLDALQLPQTVRDTVLLRLGRLEPEQVEVLRVAAVLGRSFDYELLTTVAELDAEVVLAALEGAMAQQLLEEAGANGRYTWRHALTQEAIETDTVLPKRQRIHARAADALRASGGSAMVVASHLLEAGRAEEAVDACLEAADEAERVVAYAQAAELIERALPHVPDRTDRARLLCRAGWLRWANGQPAAAQQLLVEGVRQLEALGLPLEAAQARVHLGRCQWELDQPDEALRDFETARAELDRHGASPELALAYLRIAGIHAFQLDYEQCRRAAERALAIAEEAGADFERIWALSGVALGAFGTAEELELFDRCFEEALAKGYTIIVGNVIHNEIWDRIHLLAGGLTHTIEKLDRMEVHPYGGAADYARSWALLAVGEPRPALAEARKAVSRHESLGNSKFLWRAQLAVAEALIELGRYDDAAKELPGPSPGGELQDVVYDTRARLGVALALGRDEEALELARRAVGDDALLIFRETVALAVEALIALGHADEAATALRRAQEAPAELGIAGLELAEARILLAVGRPAEARAFAERALGKLHDAELQLWVWQARILAAELAARTGAADDARSHLTACLNQTARAGAVRLHDAARVLAAGLGLKIEVAEAAPTDTAAEPDFVPAGERLVTSMFADVRGYTELTVATPPEELVDRITTLHRWAAAEIGRRHGIVDKFAGDAVMATFNISGSRVDHAVLALEAALALRDKAALMDLPVGIGVAVGPAVVTRSVDDENLSVLGPTTNLAARLQQAASGGEILLSLEAFRRVAPWLGERGLRANPEELELKGFDGAQPAYRLAAPIAAGEAA